MKAKKKDILGYKEGEDKTTTKKTHLSYGRGRTSYDISRTIHKGELYTQRRPS